MKDPSSHRVWRALPLGGVILIAWVLTEAEIRSAPALVLYASPQQASMATARGISGGHPPNARRISPANDAPPIGPPPNGPPTGG